MMHPPMSTHQGDVPPHGTPLATDARAAWTPRLGRRRRAHRAIGRHWIWHKNENSCVYTYSHLSTGVSPRCAPVTQQVAETATFAPPRVVTSEFGDGPTVSAPPA